MLIGAPTPKDFLTQMRLNYRRSQRPIHLHQWCKRLGYKSTRSLGMLLEGKRLPSLKMIELLAQDYGLTELERRYLELLILASKESGGGSSPQIQEEIEKIKEIHQRNERRLSMSEFEKVFRWHVFVIRQLVGTKDFKEDLKWIRRKLRGKVTEDEITEAIQVLLSTGGLTRDPLTGQLIKKDISMMSKEDVPSQWIRQHHREMMERSEEAIEEQGVYERELISWAFSCNKTELEKLKHFLREVRQKVDSQFAKDGGDSVFQMNIQLFQHTLDTGEQND